MAYIHFSYIIMWNMFMWAGQRSRRWPRNWRYLKSMLLV